MRALMTLAFVFFVAAVAKADTMSITASGTWDGLAPTSPESAPDASWSFSFDVTTPLAPDDTATFTNFSFRLDGAPVATQASFLKFFDSKGSGLFDLGLADGDFLFLQGQQIFDAHGALIPGTYAADVSILAGSPFPGTVGSGDGTVVVSSINPGAAVPEPASIVGLATGLVTLATLGHRRNRPARHSLPPGS
jgi:hypothetical protein